MNRRTRVSATSIASKSRALTPKQVHDIGHAVHRWLRDKQGSQRAWDQMNTACEGIHAGQIKDQSELGVMVRTWLHYLEAARRAHHSSGASDQFDQAYTAWLNWKQSARRTRRAK